MMGYLFMVSVVFYQIIFLGRLHIPSLGTYKRQVGRISAIENFQSSLIWKSTSECTEPRLKKFGILNFSVENIFNISWFCQNYYLDENDCTQCFDISFRFWENNYIFWKPVNFSTTLYINILSCIYLLKKISNTIKTHPSSVFSKSHFFVLFLTNFYNWFCKHLFYGNDISRISRITNLFQMNAQEIRGIIRKVDHDKVIYFKCSMRFWFFQSLARENIHQFSLC